jgi:glyoxylase-like metal-dependent hydrolase (beta-lactamase superfamily II)
MELHWLGSGSMVNPDLGNSNFVLQNGTRRVLVDASHDTAQLVINSGILPLIDDIIITHAHGDHMDGLEPIAFTNYWELRRKGKDKPNVYVGSQRVAAAVRMALGAKMGFANSKDGRSIDKYFRFHVGETVEIAGMPAIHLHQTPHVDYLDTYGLHIPSEGVWISGDTTAVKPLPEGTVLAFRDAGGGGVHASIDDVLAAGTQGAQVNIYHLGNDWTKIRKQAASMADTVLPGDVYVPYENGYKRIPGRSYAVRS